MLRFWFPRLIALLAGASLAAVGASFLSSYPWWELLMPMALGNWLLAGGLSVVLLPLSAVPKLRARLGSVALWAWSGLALGVVPLVASFGFAPLPLSYALGVLAAAAVIFCAARASWRALPVRWLAIIVGLTPILAVGCGVHYALWLEKFMQADAHRNSQLPVPGEFPQAAPAGAPDLILISVDTLRADAIVGARPEGYAIPWFDALREHGTWWSYALSSSNQTVPGHTGMLQGRDAMGTAVRWNRDLLPGSDHAPLVSELFRSAGFRTLGVISNDLLSAAMGFQRGYELYDDSTVPRMSMLSKPLAWHAQNSWLGILLDKRAVAWFMTNTQYWTAGKPPRSLGSIGRLGRGTVTTNQALSALDQAYAQERPFFFFLHYIDPHQPYGAPAPYAGRLTANLPPVDPAYAPTKKHGMFGLEQIDRAGRDLSSTDPAVRKAAQQAIERFHLTYLERIMFLDDQLSRVQSRLEESGRPYVILLTSDHGEHFGEHAAVLHGTTLYEEALRVPMILSGSGVPSGREGTGIATLEDVAPTLLALGGIVPPDAMKGILLHHGEAGGVGRSHVAADQARIAWRQDGWKALGRWNGSRSAEADALFLLSNDPHEANNRLAEGLPPVLKSLLTELLKLDLYQEIQRNLDFGHASVLDALGYATGSDPGNN